MSNSTESIQNEAQTGSTSSFVTALVFNTAVFAAEIAAFTLLRKYFKTIYEPRTFLTPEGKRTDPLTPRSKFWEWPLTVFQTDPDIIRQQNGLDAYMFVRFLRMMIKILLPIWFLSWSILMPLTAVNTSVPSHSGLDRFTFGNINPNTVSARYAAHLVLAWVFTFYILYILRSELSDYIALRQHHLIDPNHASTAQANTVLVTGVPAKYLSEEALRNLFGHCPGGVRTVWLNRDLKDLPSVHDRRMKACNTLEKAENALLKTALKLHNKGRKKNKGNDVEMEMGVNMDAAEAERLVPTNKRPSHRLPAGFLPFGLPLISKKVDTIEWAKAEILETNAILDAEREVLYSEIKASKKKKLHLPNLLNIKPGDRTHVEDSDDVGAASSENADGNKYPPLNSAFILFRQQIGAHVAVQALTHAQPFRMVGKYIELAPDDVVWGNLGLNPYEALIRKLISIGLTTALIVGWAIPVAFVGIVSNIHSLCTTYSWLAWLCKIPDVVIGIIQGILPAALLAVLFMLLPIVLRLLARFEGIPTRTGIELSLMTRFFIFQVVHGFLIVTISSGIIAALPELVQNPSGIPALLATKLPSASTFFLTYIILQGLTGTAGGFLTIVPLVLYYVKMFILGSTPRSIYNIKYNLRDVAWGTLFPGITLLVVITFGYSIISPIINGLACFTFFLFYMLYKYLFLWQLEMPESGDTGGLFFPKAIQHVFVGLYVQHICLAALFFLAQDAAGKPVAIPEGALMVVLLAITAFINYVINSFYAPLLYALPLSLADRAHVMQQEADEQERDDERALDMEKSPSPNGGDERDPEHEHEHSPEHDNEKAALLPRRARGPKDFEHPAVRHGQRPIWVAEDLLGVAHAEVGAMRAEGIRASTRNARMDAKGKVNVDGRPPEEK